MTQINQPFTGIILIGENGGDNVSGASNIVSPPVVIPEIPTIPPVSPACDYVGFGPGFLDDTYWVPSANCEWDGEKWLVNDDQTVTLTRITTGPNANWTLPFSSFTFSCGYNSGPTANSGEITSSINVDGGTANGGGGGHFDGAFNATGQDRRCFAFNGVAPSLTIDSIDFLNGTGEAYWSITCMGAQAR